MAADRAGKPQEPFSEGSTDMSSRPDVATVAAVELARLAEALTRVALLPPGERLPCVRSLESISAVLERRGLARAIGAALREHQRRIEQQLEKNSDLPVPVPLFVRAIAQDWARLARRANRPPGRPRRRDITQAIEMEAAGVSRKEIYRQLGKTTREKQRALREAMRQRRRRQALSAAKPTAIHP